MAKYVRAKCLLRPDDECNINEWISNNSGHPCCIWCRGEGGGGEEGEGAGATAAGSGEEDEN